MEGPSDELIVQKAFHARHAATPLERCIDVISVKSLALKRFLEIAKPLGIRVDVVTDNDGNVAAVKEKYKDYKGVKDIFIRYDADENYPTLEPQILKANNLAMLNKILRREFDTDADIIHYMTASNNKTDVALAIFETREPIKFPGYINDAIE